MTALWEEFHFWPATPTMNDGRWGRRIIVPMRKPEHCSAAATDVRSKKGLIRREAIAVSTISPNELIIQTHHLVVRIRKMVDTSTSALLQEPPLTPIRTRCPHNESDIHKSHSVTPSQKNGPLECTADASKSGSSTRSGRIFLGLIRIFALELPILLVFSAYLSTLVWERFANDYLLPQIDLMKWTPDRASRENTYYHRVCDVFDQSTTNAADLLVDVDHMTPDDVTNLMIEHGAALFPNVLSRETANELRQFILKQNAKNEDMIYVIANENRWSFFLRVDQDPSVAKVLEEMLNENPLLVSALDRIAGQNPAVIEFTTITSAYGAEKQHWHQDVVPESNGAKYSRSFIPSYSLFIPLQDTTAAMGATGVCPGTHMCADGCGEFCEESGFQMSKAYRNETGNEFWPVGWGALVNQQTTHVGMPHTDPNAPHRVVLVITFAPRPKFGEKELETRMIGMGGSYSLHWSQWGHTLQDFADPDRRMGQPWRTLRSMGLFKPASVDWGWDFMTQAAGRISNAEVGYFRDEFDSFFKAGGFFFLPSTWQGQSPLEEVDDTDTWIQFLAETTYLCQSNLRTVYVSFLVVYLTFHALPCFAHRQDSVIRKSLRLVSLHIFVVGTTIWIYRRMESRTWAQNVRRGISYRVPVGPHALLPDIPASLPTKEDILILDEMQSDYMASFDRVLEVTHPGNKIWNKLIEANSIGYHSLSYQLQEKLRSTILQIVLEQKQRIMTKTSYSSWAPVDSVTADWFCHKGLASKGNRFVQEATTQLGYLLAETRFGYWHDTALHRKHIPNLLQDLQHRVLHHSHERRSQAPSVQLLKLGSSRPSLSLRKKLRIFLKKAGLPKRSRLPPRPEPLEPFLGAWLQEGDIVEATYDGRFEEWYRGFITFADPERSSWDVEYDDGDLNESLCRQCVRPFSPYVAGESVEVRVADGRYVPGKVVTALVDEAESCHVQLDSGALIKNVQVLDVRRVTAKKRRVANQSFSRGERVFALFPGDPSDDLYPGVVTKVNQDGTYAIEYEDGDYASRVQGRDIRPDFK